MKFRGEDVAVQDSGEVENVRSAKPLVALISRRGRKALQPGHGDTGQAHIWELDGDLLAQAVDVIDACEAIVIGASASRKLRNQVLQHVIAKKRPARLVQMCGNDMRSSRLDQIVKACLAYPIGGKAATACLADDETGNISITDVAVGDDQAEADEQAVDAIVWTMVGSLQKLHDELLITLLIEGSYRRLICAHEGISSALKTVLQGIVLSTVSRLGCDAMIEMRLGIGDNDGIEIEVIDEGPQIAIPEILRLGRKDLRTPLGMAAHKARMMGWTFSADTSKSAGTMIMLSLPAKNFILP